MGVGTGGRGAGCPVGTVPRKGRHGKPGVERFASSAALGMDLECERTFANIAWGLE
jgi:hypothetical protein